ncbi:MAG: hypothetical protein WC774_04080 [Candidatus Gracilibacteria bacterium]
MFIIKICYALIGIAMGLSILKYRKVVYSWTGKFYWAEKYLGSGGTVFIISLIGLGLIFVSVVYPFGFLDGPPRGNNTNTETTITQP